MPKRQLSWIKQRMPRQHWQLRTLHNVKAECEDWGFDFACSAHQKRLGETPEMLLLSEGCDQMRSIQWMMNSGFKFGNIRA
mmetsp:Transcript_3028/g.5731  ORF Transcript_3028/g.5731 Transcript_3028/m.5731 type:complete len:81 (-) Transcript_3028:27-269(-)